MIFRSERSFCWILPCTGTNALRVEQLAEKALASANRVYARARGRVVLEAEIGAPDLARNIEHAYFGHTAP